MQTMIISVLVFLWLGISPGLAAEKDKTPSLEPPLPKKGVRVIPPDPQLPPEVRAFSGIWEGTYSLYSQPQPATINYARAILVVEQIISPEKVQVIYSLGPQADDWGKPSWKKYWATISEVNGSYSLTFQRKDGGVHTFNLKGDKLTTWFGFDRNKYHMEMTRRPDQPEKQSDHLAAAPPLPPEGVKVTPPNPQLPPEIRAFSGTWEGTWSFYPHEAGLENRRRAILIVEEIVSPEKVRVVYSWGPTADGEKPGWRRYWGSIAKEKDRYVLSYKKQDGKPMTFALEGNQLVSWTDKWKLQIKMSRKPDKS